MTEDEAIKIFDDINVLCTDINDAIEEDRLTHDEKLQLAEGLRELIEGLEKLEID